MRIAGAQFKIQSGSIGLLDSIVLHVDLLQLGPMSNFKVSRS